MDESEFRIAVDIAAPPDIVWQVMRDAERWHEWTASVTSIRVLGNQPLAVGTRAVIRQPRFPPAVWKVTELEPGHSFTWKSGFPGSWVYATHTVNPTNAGSHVTLRLRYEGAIGRLLARMTRDITNRYLAMEAAGLKRRSEDREHNLTRQ
jgi:uncharacterized protein YndB with AHSA1/START domain